MWGYRHEESLERRDVLDIGTLVADLIVHLGEGGAAETRELGDGNPYQNARTRQLHIYEQRVQQKISAERTQPTPAQTLRSTKEQNVCKLTDQE